MMLAPRSYLFSRTSSPSSPRPSSTPAKRRDDPKTSKKPDPLKRHALREMSPTQTATTTAKPTTSDPVIIPIRSHRESSRDSQRLSERNEYRQHARKQADRPAQRARDVHTPDSIPASVAALLAVTSIPPLKRQSPTFRRNGQAHQRLTVDAILQHTNVAEKEFSMSFGKTPLDILLSPPEDLEDSDTIGSEAGMESYLSTRTISTDSVPSLEDGSVGDSSLSLGSLVTPSLRGKRSVPRRRLQSLPLSSPPGELNFGHPLSIPDIDVDELDFRVFNRPALGDDQDSFIEVAAPRRKSAFKSNLTASLRALRYAAKSLSNMTAPMITPDDFLTRSIISIDPSVPFTDERMPPRLEDTPTPALRRYLNPTTNAPIEAHVPSSLAQTTSSVPITASIQMQTYRVSKSTRTSSPSVISRRTNTNTPEQVFAEVAAGPLARQRDMRENSDFIRVAVMEMLMRRNGKLDEKVPGRAKWALPPRRPSTKPYEIGEGGVPVRWTSISA